MFFLLFFNQLNLNKQLLLINQAGYSQLILTIRFVLENTTLET